MPARWPGAVAGGFVTHPTNSNPRYLLERCLPALAEGAAHAGRDLRRDGFELVVGTSVVTGSTRDAVLAERERQRRLLAFLYSTPAYAPTLAALRMGRPRPPAARPRPSRPLGRTRPRPLRRSARRTGAERDLRRAPRPRARTLRRARSGHHPRGAGRPGGRRRVRRRGRRHPRWVSEARPERGPGTLRSLNPASRGRAGRHAALAAAGVYPGGMRSGRVARFTRPWGR